MEEYAVRASYYYYYDFIRIHMIKEEIEALRRQTTGILALRFCLHDELEN